MDVRLVVVNGDFSHGRKGGSRTLKRAARLGDVLFGQEFKFVEGEDVLDSKVWDVVQYDGDAGRRGSLLAVRRSVGEILEHRLVLGTDNDGAAMHDRYFIVAEVRLRDGRVYTMVAGHMPPKRFWRLWPAMRDSLARVTSTAEHPVIVGCDWNRLGRFVRVATGLRWRGVGILGFAYSPGLRISKARGRRVGSDHLSPVAVLHP